MVSVDRLVKMHPMTTSGVFNTAEINWLRAEGRIATPSPVLIGWGTNTGNPIGAGPIASESYPRRTYTVTSLTGPLRHLSAANSATSCSGFVTAEGQLWTMGYASSSTNGRTTGGTALGQVGTDTDWAKFESGNVWSLALKQNGTLWSVGAGTLYKTGHGSTAGKTTFTQIGTATYLDMSADLNGGVAIATDGTLWTWGENTYGRTGLGLSSGNTMVPTQVGTDTDWVACWTGPQYTVVKKSDGTVWGCGVSSMQSVLGTTNVTNTTLFQISPDNSWANVYPGREHMFVLKNDGTLWFRGKRIVMKAGEVGNTATLVEATPGKTWVTFASGYDCGWGIDSDGGLYHVGHTSPTYDYFLGTTWTNLTQYGQVPVTAKISSGINLAATLISLE